ncbi:hypothetical protein [Neomicrococcus lactis]|uniref:Uncharacterized protein n=1 Tax=Neomicrococcus lactis TaxID=732241 RepID=A0A7W8YCQ1_9MICC|nr:hypothetical protein [Neomicrococcus lactis]MBB5598966.1 hypothetical protein [Neomicrococcus lactis]
MQIWQYLVIVISVLIVAFLALIIRQFIVGWKTPADERTVEKSKEL